MKSIKVSFKSGQCGGGILETDELYSEPNEPSSVSFQVELIYRDLNAVYFDIHDIMGKQENALYCLGSFLWMLEPGQWTWRRGRPRFSFVRMHHTHNDFSLEEHHLPTVIIWVVLRCATIPKSSHP